MTAHIQCHALRFRCIKGLTLARDYRLMANRQSRIRCSSVTGLASDVVQAVANIRKPISVS